MKSTYKVLLALLCVYFISLVPNTVIVCEAKNADAANEVHTIMNRVLDRCYSSNNGVSRISWQSPTSEDFSQIKQLGGAAIVPLASYLTLPHKDGFSQLFAVKFLIAIGGPSTFEPLVRAAAPDQWEVTRAQALSGLYQVEPARAKPYIRSDLADESHLVRQRAHELIKLYPRSN